MHESLQCVAVFPWMHHIGSFIAVVRHSEEGHDYFPHEKATQGDLQSTDDLCNKDVVYIWQYVKYKVGRCGVYEKYLEPVPFPTPFREGTRSLGWHMCKKDQSKIITY